MNILELETTIDIGYDSSLLQTHLRQLLNLSPSDELYYQILKRSVDARRQPIKTRLKLAVYDGSEELVKQTQSPLNFVPLKPHVPKVVIVGAGPAGLFAALRVLSLGLKPIVLERGHQVRERRRDLALLNRKGQVNPESNYCFGEGGAGTYSDGKLYTRSKKRGSIRAILQLLVDHGAPSEILYEAQPHIGTNRLPRVIQSIRETIIAHGGEVFFQSKVVDFICEKISSLEHRVTGVILESGKVISNATGVILATGHSARDIFELLEKKQIQIEAKPFALGVRVEHPQTLIDHIQYHGDRPKQLGSAAYKVVTQVDQRGVFSFCMCPGGIIAPAATNTNEIVVNGWSPYKRNGKFANSGMVVSVGEQDYRSFEHYPQDPLAALRYQTHIEQQAYIKGGASGVTAPAQRLADFIKQRYSKTLPECSYIPGVKSALLQEVLPRPIEARLRKGFQHFNQRLKGFIHPEAIVVGVESRTSSPIRIPRDKQTLQHPTHKNLFPCGEGAGYAGGIVSAALDGFKCAEALATNHQNIQDLWANVFRALEQLKGGLGR